VALQYLALGSGISVPHTAGLVATCCNDFVALWVELDLRYLIGLLGRVKLIAFPFLRFCPVRICVALQESGACPCEYVVNSGDIVS
jgi:hypothetical protein